jgi:hypothetical protein
LWRAVEFAEALPTKEMRNAVSNALIALCVNADDTSNAFRLLAARHADATLNCYTLNALVTAVPVAAMTDTTASGGFVLGALRSLTSQASMQTYRYELLERICALYASEHVRPNANTTRCLLATLFQVDCFACTRGSHHTL